MKIYFAGSIRAGRQDAEIYHQLIAGLSEFGNVLTEHIGSITDARGPLSVEEIYKRDIEWIQEADCIVAEVTQPSLGVGYEISYAEKLGKKIYCCFRPNANQSLSAMVLGNPSCYIIYYTNINEAIDQLRPIIKK